MNDVTLGRGVSLAPFLDFDKTRKNAKLQTQRSDVYFAGRTLLMLQYVLSLRDGVLFESKFLLFQFQYFKNFILWIVVCVKWCTGVFGYCVCVYFTVFRGDMELFRGRKISDKH